MNKYINLAKESIKYFLNNKSALPISKNISADLLKNQAGVFVSLHTKNNELRGCIGTFLPTRDNIAQEIIHNAISAAFKDPRFLPLQKNELESLNINVDILSAPEKIESIDELDPKKFGILLKTNDNRSGLLLPDLDGINTTQEQLLIASQKGNIDIENDIYQIYKFTVKRHE